MMTLGKSHKPECRRSGAVLIFVLLVLATLSLGVYSFSEHALAEYQALRLGTDQTRAYVAAESGIEWVANQLERQTHDQESYSLSWGDSEQRKLTFEIYPTATAPEPTGPLNECAKLNLNSLALDAANTLVSRQRLLAIPGMTAVAADSLLDWIDEDEHQREFGAETAWYLAQGLPQRPRQAAMESLEELLLVRGFSHNMLHQTNQSALTTSRPTLTTIPAEYAANKTMLEHLTVCSAESNFNAQGIPKININQDALEKLFGQLELALGTEAARFIVAMRMNGPIKHDNVFKFDSDEAVKQRKATASARAFDQTQHALTFSRVTPKVIGGFEINRTGSYRIESVASLIGRRARAKVNDGEKIIESPWNANGTALVNELGRLESILTTSDNSKIHGRINPSIASYEVLKTIPGMTDHLATQIQKKRNRSTQHSIGWLVAENIMGLKTLRQLSPYMTSGGDVFSGISIGVVDDRRAAIAFRIDATRQQPFITSMHRL